ncbi:GNAT family N-acetyltransferase [Candidatus Woesearchaeota archaeon]|nr:GNAT family N-acetyltransferase [Candidatus Woesearchaeota archaeon]
MAVKVLVIVQARMASSRLPGKILMKIDGKPLIQHTLERLKKVRNVDDIVLATSTSKSDDAVERLCRRIKVKCFRGSENDVLSRFIGAAKPYNPEFVVRISGDQPLLDNTLIEDMIDRHIESGADYSVSTDQVPKGFNLEVINYSALKRADEEAKSQPHREHVTKYVADNPDKFRNQSMGFGEKLARPDIVLTVDTREDFDFVSRIYSALKKEENQNDYSAEDIIRLIDTGIVARKPIIILRADGSKEKGIGDVVSLINIADNLKEHYELVFATKDYPESVDFIKKKGYEAFAMPVDYCSNDDIKFIKALCNKRRIKYCIIELFPNNADYVKELSGFLKVLMVDFSGGIPVYSDMLLNWELYAKEMKYDIKNNEMLSLIGPEYIPMNKNILKYCKKKSNLSAKRIKEIFVSFGGGDPHNMSFSVLGAVERIAKKYSFTFILGPNFKRFEEFEKKAKKIKGKIKIVIAPKNFHELLSKSDLVICGGGLTAFELCAMGVPFIGTSKLEWEVKRLKKLESLGACRFVEPDSRLADDLLKCLDAPAKGFIEKAAKGRKIVDGKGSTRIADAIRKRWKEEPRIKEKKKGKYYLKQISQISSEEAGKLINFCSENSNIELDNIGLDKKSFYEKRINDFVGKKKPGFMLSDGSGQAAGIILFEKLEFDTELFEVNSWRITDLIVVNKPGNGASSVCTLLLDEAEKMIRKENGRFIQCKVDERNDMVCQALGNEDYSLISDDVILRKDLGAAKQKPSDNDKNNDNKANNNPANDYIIKFCEEPDVKALYSLSKKAYTTTRFHQDKNIRKEHANEMQGLWARNCYHQKLSDEIILVKGRKDDDLYGYVACSVIKDKFEGEKKAGRIVLIATHEKHRGKGIGSILIKESDDWFIKQGCNQAVVGTQTINIPAINFYQKNGYKVISHTLAFHKWL